MNIILKVYVDDTGWVTRVVDTNNINDSEIFDILTCDECPFIFPENTTSKEFAEFYKWIDALIDTSSEWYQYIVADTFCPNVIYLFDSGICRSLEHHIQHTEISLRYFNNIRNIKEELV